MENKIDSNYKRLDPNSIILPEFGVEIIDKSKENELDLSFHYTEPKGNGFTHYKFKEPLDCLHYITKNWKKMYPIETVKLFEYASNFITKNIFTPRDIYDLLFLEMVLYYNLEFNISIKLPNVSENICLEDKLNLLEDLKVFEENLNVYTRLAHRFAVANTWYYYNFYKKYNSNGVEAKYHRDEAYFGNNYKNKKVDFTTGFNLNRRIWQVYFKDNSWLLAFDVGNGWYVPLTNFNSLKIVN